MEEVTTFEDIELAVDEWANVLGNAGFDAIEAIDTDTNLLTQLTAAITIQNSSWASTANPTEAPSDGTDNKLMWILVPVGTVVVFGSIFAVMASQKWARRKGEIGHSLVQGFSWSSDKSFI